MLTEIYAFYDYEVIAEINQHMHYIYQSTTLI